MRTQTAISAALKHAGANTDEALLYTIAVDQLKKHTSDPHKAAKSFTAEIYDGGGILAELMGISRAKVRAKALPYLQRVARDMGGDDLPGHRQEAHAESGQITCATTRQADGDAGANAIVPITAKTLLPAASPPGRETCQSSKEEKSGGGQSASADNGHSNRAAPAREPSAAERRAAGRVAKASAKAVLADLGWLGAATIPGGPPLIDLRWGDLPGMIKRQIREVGARAQMSVVLKAIEQEGRKSGHMDPKRKWIDDLSPAVVKRLSAMTDDEMLKEILPDWIRAFSDSTSKRLLKGPPNA